MLVSHPGPDRARKKSIASGMTQIFEICNREWHYDYCCRFRRGKSGHALSRDARGDMINQISSDLLASITLKVSRSTDRKIFQK